MTCKDHFPIINWDVMYRDHDLVVYKCPDCGEISEVKQGYGEGVNIISESYDKMLEASRPLVQPFREGVPSAEYVALTGGKNMSKEDQKRAKRVWSDVPGLKDVVIK